MPSVFSYRTPTSFELTCRDPFTKGIVVATLEADLARVWRSAETLGRDLRAERKRRKEENARRDVEHKAERGRVRKEVEDLCICRICGYCVHVIFVF
jgi:hypothetical protein